MLKFGPTGFDPDFLSNPENLNLTEWFDAFPTDDGAVIPAMAVDNPLTGLSLQLDSGFLDALFAEGGNTVGGDGADPDDDIAPAFGTGISDDGPEASISAAGAFEPGEQAFFSIQVSEDFATGFRTDELPINAIPFSAESAPGARGAPADSDLVFLDLDFSAKGGNGGGGGGGGGKKVKESDSEPSADPNVLSTYTSGDENIDDSFEYNIQINFKGSWTVDLQAAVVDSADWISDLIEGDIFDVFYRGKIIDDIRIDAEMTAIDGVGGILGRAGPTAIRIDGGLPALAIMEFDVADAAFYNSQSGGMLWDDIVTHEMMHTVGFGTIWNYLGLLAGGGTDNPTFTGENATGVYEASSFYDPDSGYPVSGDPDFGVPVEGNIGPGSDDSHWDDDTFGNEIMTGYISPDNYLSDMTVASLEDLGYATVWPDNSLPPVEDIFIA